MRGRGSLMVGLWAGATALATLAAWTGVSAVTHAVTDSVQPTLGADQVAALSAPATVASTTTTTIRRPPTTVARPQPAPTHSAPPPQPAPLTTAAPTTTRAPQPVFNQTRTVSTAGGIAAVSCAGDNISLTSATPADGYRVDVVSGGPARVDVRFEGAHDVWGVEATCQQGMVLLETPHGPPPRGGPGPGGGGSPGGPPPFPRDH